MQLYDLSLDSKKNYNLDLSMFERLVRSKTAPHSMLSTQRRMHPDISQLVRATVYPELKNHPLVANYPPVKGMGKSLVFFDHDHCESDADDDESKSKSNSWEVEMIFGFVGYMLRQGYQPGQITVITPYVGQLLKLRCACLYVCMYLCMYVCTFLGYMLGRSLSLRRMWDSC